LSGFCFGLFWITREEGIWVLPSFAFITLYSLYLSHHRKLLLKHLAIYIVFSLALPIATGLINNHKYGRFQIVDFKSSSFVNVINALNRVDVGEEQQFVPVPRKKRDAIYKISPSFRELRVFFENSRNEWLKPGCNVNSSTCGDYAGGWFVFALRDGASSLGYYKDAISITSYYDRISKEINLACNSRKLSCINNPIPYMPRLTKDAIKSIPKKITEAIKLTIYKKKVALTAGQSWGTPYSLNQTLNFLGNPKAVPLNTQSILLASGWYYTKNNDWISLRCSSQGSRRDLDINKSPSFDIAEYFKDDKASNQRFSFEIDDFENCSILFLNSRNQPIQLSEALKNNQRYFNIIDGYLNFDVLQEDRINKENSLFLKQSLINFYELISIYIFCAGTFFIIAILLFLSKNHKLDQLSSIALFLWILYYSRIFLVVMVDISSFPAIKNLYLLPAFPVWTAASFVSMAAFFNTVRPIFLEIRKINYWTF
jgi:hypothetical protein